eukprot:gb/GECH01000653.1/.p1 GENE.gb/GECH01000653.1/~~gb/GECH01000653.1/.p1  ORF type:complete len:110 (+),score=36.97 gb/GECH01000653.1/:1-330(+)
MSKRKVYIPPLPRDYWDPDYPKALPDECEDFMNKFIECENKHVNEPDLCEEEKEDYMNCRQRMLQEDRKREKYAENMRRLLYFKEYGGIRMKTPKTSIQQNWEPPTDNE